MPKRGAFRQISIPHLQFATSKQKNELVSKRLVVESFDYIQSSELLHQVSAAKVLWADYDRICAGPDGAQHAIGNLGYVEKRAIDCWLATSAGVLSQHQCAENPVNDKVETTTQTRVGHRPIRYGRSAIVATEGLLSGLWPVLDVKGCGVVDAARPEVSPHGTGVVGMCRAFRELILVKFFETLFAQLTDTVQPVKILAVISLGIDVRLADRRDTACVLVRAPHIRPSHNREIPERGSVEMKVKIALEALFMTFGFSSAWKFMEMVCKNGHYINALDCGGPHPALEDVHIKAMLDHLSDGKFYEFGMANIQLCRMVDVSPLAADIIDLEHFFFKEKFDMDVWFPAYSQPLSWGYLCPVRDTRFVQPNKDLLERTGPMRAALGHNLPTHKAAFAYGASCEKDLQAGVNPAQIMKETQALFYAIQSSAPQGLFNDPVEILGERLQPRKLDRWALKWADSIMSDPWPAFLQRKDAGA